MTDAVKSLQWQLHSRNSIRSSKGIIIILLSTQNYMYTCQKLQNALHIILHVSINVWHEDA